METKFQKIQNSMPVIFGTHDVQFVKLDDSTCCVRSFKTGMFCSVELRDLISLCDSLELGFFVRTRSLDNFVDCVEFVIYS